MADLTLAERERLVKLNEELSESMERTAALIQAMGKVNQTVCKALLHGYEASFESIDYSNREDLMRELGDVEAIKTVMIERGDLSREKIEAYRDLKLPKLPRYLKHQNKESS